jgi:hypothetical protein
MLVRELDKGMGTAVAARTVYRPSDNGSWEAVAHRVAEGNTSLHSSGAADFLPMKRAIASGSLLMSGRHLQHGDSTQKHRAIEVLSNCSTAASSFAKFYLLLNGSGVGRSYDDAMMAVDWQNAPLLIQALSANHPDFPKTKDQIDAFAQHWELDDFAARDVLMSLGVTGGRIDFYKADAHYLVFDVPDTREGWADAVELYESMAFNHDKRILVLNWTEVRCKGSPIGGMQDRPASGPMSPMRALNRIQSQVTRSQERIPRWKQAMLVDHYLSVEVQVGGARRAARMATKDWKDPDIIDFIYIKSRGGLWTSNNSVMVDKEFWRLYDQKDVRVVLIFNAIADCSFINGEPGTINGDLLTVKGERQHHADGSDFRSDRYWAKVSGSLQEDLFNRASKCRFKYIVNPCGEIVLHVLGAYCVIADVAPALAFPGPLSRAISIRSELTAGAKLSVLIDDDGDCDFAFAEWDLNFILAAELATRALIRVNLMPALYQQEVKRTNRIGVGLTGIHEYAWLRFGLTFEDLLDPVASKDFWAMISKVSQAVKKEAIRYSLEMGVEPPHTSVTMKPAGTTSKLHALTEGAHEASFAAALRWVQFANADPLIAIYAAKGYPTRKLTKDYVGVTIVGFPLVPLITRIGMPWVSTSADHTPAQQYEYLRMLEKHWIGTDQGNQVSYTMKIDTSKVSLEEYKEILALNQRTVKCCTVMPQNPAAAMGYEYLPEEHVTIEALQLIVDGINDPEMVQELDLDSLRCASGACPM